MENDENEKQEKKERKNVSMAITVHPLIASAYRQAGLQLGISGNRIMADVVLGIRKPLRDIKGMQVDIEEYLLQKEEESEQ